MSSNKFQDVDFDALRKGVKTEEYPLEDVFGAEEVNEDKSIKSDAAKSDSSENVTGEILYYFYPSWRSQLLNLIGFFISSNWCCLGFKGIIQLCCNSWRAIFHLIYSICFISADFGLCAWIFSD